MNVSTGVELPSELEIKCFTYGKGYSTAAHEVNARCNCTIPAFLCENYTGFMVSISNSASSSTPILLSYPGGTSKTISQNTRYTIADYLTKSGTLIVTIDNLSRSTSAGYVFMDTSATIIVKLIKS